MLGPLAILCALLFPGSGAGLKLDQPDVVVERLGKTASLPCKVDTRVSYIHWYRYQEGSAPQRLLYFDVSGSFARRDLVLKADKVNAKKGRDGYSCNLSVLKLEKSDEGVYYCAAWEWKNWKKTKVFGPGTMLRVTDKSPDEDISPKPTIFFPSIAEIKVQKAGTYLCLLEDFFPDVIKIDWKEKDGKTVLTSQQGDTVKTEDTYMKFSWLTLTEASLDKEHKCIVKHDKNKKGVDQEILFPSIDKDLVAAMESEADSRGHSETKQNTDVVTVSPSSSGSFSPVPRAVELTAINSTDASLNDENDTLQLQLTNTSAYYTYLLLLVKTLVYSAIIAICLLGRPALCGNGKSS
ncbi:T cell receptor gamma constant 2 isoform X2 [Ailuropoda melanoleuca]|uniref:T cell receptor gamma constant 2 isoform X2 n=1 Tax=Ailuropoda melanoleuca TaxID=9646 RepID=UPI001494F280|nr:T cell receptor gamma constant 2 isoform X2 [Ailuropoda melanoleuca]